MFEDVTSAIYGSCYSFNSNVTGNSTGLLSSSLPGPVMGLTLVLGLDQADYMKSGLTKGAGARLPSNYIKNRISGLFQDYFAQQFSSSFN